jgi:hypothetical protein
VGPCAGMGASGCLSFVVSVGLLQLLASAVSILASWRQLSRTTTHGLGEIDATKRRVTSLRLMTSIDSTALLMYTVNKSGGIYNVHPGVTTRNILHCPRREQMFQLNHADVLSGFTEPQNLQVQKLCSIPSSPHTPQFHPALTAGLGA